MFASSCKRGITVMTYDIEHVLTRFRVYLGIMPRYASRIHYTVDRDEM